MIEDAHRRWPRTTLIVTHDLPTCGIAEVAPGSTPQRLVERLALGGARARRPVHAEAARVGGVAASGRSASERTASGSRGGFALELVPRWPRVRYGLRYLATTWHWRRRRRLLLWRGGVLVGFVAAYHVREDAAPHFASRSSSTTSSALGFMLFRVLAPVLVTPLVAAHRLRSRRVGSKVTRGSSTRPSSGVCRSTC
jgi:hypothetical protein